MLVQTIKKISFHKYFIKWRTVSGDRGGKHSGVTVGREMIEKFFLLQ